MRNGYVEVELDKPRKLRFDFNALADVEAKLGAGIGEVFKEERMGFGTIRALYWAGLKWQDKGLTIERTGTILQHCIKDDKVTMSDLGDWLTKGMQASGLLKSGSDEQKETDEDSEEFEVAEKN